MIIDAHAHYESRVLDINGLLEKMSQAGVSKTVLIAPLTNPPETEKSGILMAIQRSMYYSRFLRPAAISITRSMYSKSGEWNLWYRKYNANKQRFSIITEPDNEGIAVVVSRYPDRLLGWIFINPNNNDALDQLERWHNKPGMIGVKIHPFWHSFPIKRVETVARRTEELGLPMLVHLGFGESGDYGWLVEKFPNLKIIFSHLGIPFYKDIWYFTKNKPNVFMDISSTYHVDCKLVREAVKIAGPHKCIFGTDNPYGCSDAIIKIKRWVEDLDITDNDKEGMFSGNFMKLIK